jgi:hypothetical protein
VTVPAALIVSGFHAKNAKTTSTSQHAHAAVRNAISHVGTVTGSVREVDFPWKVSVSLREVDVPRLLAPTTLV